MDRWTKQTCAETAIIASIVDAAALADVLAVGAASSTVDAGLRARPLTEARRFAREWEREASLRLRAGDPDVLRIYHQHGRLLDACTREQAEQSAARAWLGDTLAGAPPAAAGRHQRETGYVWRDSRALSHACHRPGVTGDGVGEGAAGLGQPDLVRQTHGSSRSG